MQPIHIQGANEKKKIFVLRTVASNHLKYYQSDMQFFANVIIKALWTPKMSQICRPLFIFSVKPSTSLTNRQKRKEKAPHAFNSAACQGCHGVQVLA